MIKKMKELAASVLVTALLLVAGDDDRENYGS